MKRLTKSLLVLLLGFMLIPMVYAKELPREGVTYFLVYPNGTEDVTENYTEATNPQEKLIYSGTTDVNGKINLCDWSTEGEIRVVQHVPDGYTTNQREMTIDLSKTDGASFVDYRGGNPGTNRSLYVILGVAGVVGLTIVLSKKKKKQALIVPIIALGLFVVNVKAGTCNCVTVKDGQGNALAGVQIDIYAKPVVDAEPAVKYDANGGHFFDGTEYMYVRIPSEECSVDEFWNSLSEEQAYYIEDNIWGAYRAGYYPDGVDYPATLTNGTVLLLEWYEASDARLGTIYGNGGTYNFYGKELEEVTVYRNNNPDYLIKEFKNGDKYVIGTDTTSSCSEYNAYGLKNTNDYGKLNPTPKSKLYLCWHNKPDGVYVNGEVYLGNRNSCYLESAMYISSTMVELYKGVYHDVLILNYDNTTGDIVVTQSAISIAEEADLRIGGLAKPALETLEIVNNGQTVVAFTKNDFTLTDDGYVIADSEKKDLLLSYYRDLYNHCGVDVAEAWN